MKTIKPKKIDDDLIEELLEQAIDGVIVCPVCGNKLEPDAKECGECGWMNILILGGYI